jgi:UDP-2-acetamido-3-amino-2,3-dideoxy-glucuronate N-acetyltransferase
MVGVPAKQIGWMSDYGEQIPLPLVGYDEYPCDYTGTIYQLNGNVMKKVIK